ncbi:hypothetical protein CAL7716_042800 [Calothrix sp. PCC 7716]|nr:hypothetical protein CAL7716_042800 [Calothrix sp. PCC 7716]
MVVKVTSKSKFQSNPDDTRERRLEILNLLAEEDTVCCIKSSRCGIYKGFQDLPMPDAWVIFNDGEVHEPVNPLYLLKQPTWQKGGRILSKEKGHGTIVDVTPFLTIVDLDVGERHSFEHGKNDLVQERRSEGVREGESQGLIKGEKKLINDKNQSSSLTPKLANPFDIPNDLDGEALSKKEVEELIERIIENSDSIKSLGLFAKNFTRYALVKIDARSGYKAFGCDSMSAFLEKHHSLFKKAYSSLQKEWQAARLEYDLGFKIGTLPEIQARELYPLKDNIENCRKAWHRACELALEENRKIKSADIAIAVREIAQLPPPPKKIKTKCGWVAGPNATRHYRVKLYDKEINLHDTYDSAACAIINLAIARGQAPEELIIEGLLGALGEALGVGNATALYITKNQKTNSLFSNIQNESASGATLTSCEVVESVPNNTSNSNQEESFIEQKNSSLESNVPPSGFASLPHNATLLNGGNPRTEVAPETETRQLDSPPSETEIFEAEVIEESSGLVKSAGEKKTSPEVARIIEAYENSGVIPSPIELKQWANEVIGDTVSHYRKSGRILYTAPNDVDYGFITYLAKRLKNQENTAGASAWIRAMEKDPGRWQELSECVTQWRKEQFLSSEEGKVAKRVYNKASGSILSDYEDLGIFD